MSKLSVTLTNNDNAYYDLIFDLDDTSIAQRWFDEVIHGYEFHEDWRFTGWPNSVWTADKYVDTINECIDVINDYQPNTIDSQAEYGMSSEQTNDLHQIFESLRGGGNRFGGDGEWFTNAPDTVKRAVDGLNVYIHNYEKLNNRPFLSPTITCTFISPRFDLQPEDYSLFTYDWKFGIVYLNYREVGKHLLEVFVDQDDIVCDHTIHYYSADFKIKFITDTPREMFEDFSNRFTSWIESNRDKLTSLGNPLDKLGLGLIPVARLNYSDSGFEGMSQLEIINQLKDFVKVKSVTAVNS